MIPGDADYYREQAREERDRATVLVGHVAALAACLEIACDYARTGTAPNEATAALWRQYIEAARRREP